MLGKDEPVFPSLFPDLTQGKVSKHTCANRHPHAQRLSLLPNEKDASLIAPFKIAEEAEAKQFCDKSAGGPIAAASLCCRSLLSIKPIR